MAPAQGWHAKSWSVPHFFVCMCTYAKNCNSLDLKLSKDGTLIFASFGPRLKQKWKKISSMRTSFWEFLGSIVWCRTAFKWYKVKLKYVSKMGHFSCSECFFLKALNYLNKMLQIFEIAFILRIILLQKMIPRSCIKTNSQV